MYLPYSLNFSKIALVEFQCEPVSLDVNKVFFMKNRISLIGMKYQEKVKVLLNGVDVGNVQ